MPPKGRKGGGAGDKPKTGEEERPEPLQAVILADPFKTRFSPFTLERPRCLLPVANTPLIEYTFEFLANAGVEEVFVYSGAHTDQVEEYILQSKWSTSSASSPFSKLEIIRSSSRSIGDAMRDLDKRAMLVGDFLIVYGDVVSNLPLEPALAAHRARRAADKNAIMTMVLREAGQTHRTKAQEASPVFVIDPIKNRCLHYEQMHARQSNHFVNIDPDLLSSHQELEIRQDLIDCGIDICTPDVLALWSDNFDFEAPRKGFLHSVLKDYELNGKTIHTHIVSDHYAARVRNLRAYDAVSRDIISRWAYPLCPDSNLLKGQTYRLQKGNIYKENDVILARSCVINRRSVIGAKTSIGDGSTISNSVVGRQCIIGRNVTIDGAYIWDSAVIGDGSTVTKAIVASEAAVGRRCSVEPGALIGEGVRIADGVTVPGTSRITRAKRKRGAEDYFGRDEPDARLVGQGGDGYEFIDSDEEDEEGIEGLTSNGLVYNMQNLALSTESISTLNSEDELSEDRIAHHDRSAAGSFISIASDDSHASQHAGDFHHDAAASIFDSLQKGDEWENIQLELTALRMSTNASEHQLRRAVVAAFMKRISQVVEAGTPAKAAVDEVLKGYGELVKKTMFDEGDRVDFLLLMQSDLAHRKEGANVLLYMCMELYRLDVMSAEVFEKWWEDPKGKESGEVESVRGKTQQFIDFLKEESEEESEDEEEEEDDDEE
ncbi:translation initiation factor eIF-2B epsilon subunit, GEF [Coniosporium apollinis]|uniref:Mannose-1-phosphate guanyltransferase n=1 Tax=Coniosporium apollinis TaxID=61459 RepID=A0ABQ9NZN6_9PEZI|nr:translation initiation factor eIF-2B epsilon subunit, GEF [Coniosporium apollinis]